MQIDLPERKRVKLKRDVISKQTSTTISDNCDLGIQAMRPPRSTQSIPFSRPPRIGLDILPRPLAPQPMANILLVLHLSRINASWITNKERNPDGFFIGVSFIPFSMLVHHGSMIGRVYNNRITGNP